MGSEMFERVRKVLLLWALNGSENTAECTRDVLEAMREPTEAMEEAGNYPTPYRLEYEGGRQMVHEVWKAMIDEALKAQSPETDGE